MNILGIYVHLTLAVDVQPHLLLPVRDEDVAFGGGDDDALLRRRRADVLGQVHLDDEDVSLHGHLDVFHCHVHLFSVMPFHKSFRSATCIFCIYTYIPKGGT